MKKQIVFRNLFLIKIFRMKVLGDHILKFYFQHFFKICAKFTLAEHHADVFLWVLHNFVEQPF